MNYLNIINKCLTELNYKSVNSFSELVKNEHIKIKNIINVINSEICSSFKWNFLLRTKTVSLPANTGDIENPIFGKILYLTIDNQKYLYDDNFEKFFTNEQKPLTYTIFNDKILLPQFREDKLIEIVYYTLNSTKNNNGIEKSSLEFFDDETLIPDPFAEPILVYGTCMRLKGNPQHIRFNYWLSMYKTALANLVADSSPSANDTPHVKLSRN